LRRRLELILIEWNHLIEWNQEWGGRSAPTLPGLPAWARGEGQLSPCAARACSGAIETPLSIVMPALVAGIHVFLGRSSEKGADGRDEPGPDSERRFNIIGIRSN
jgi:hypothetical protein